MWNNLSLSRKLALGFVASALILTVLVVQSSRTLGSLDTLQSESTQRSAEMLVAAQGALLSARMYQAAGDTLEAGGTDQIIEEWAAAKGELQSQLNVIEQTATSDAAQVCIDRAQTAVGETVRLYDRELAASPGKGALSSAMLNSVVAKVHAEADQVADCFRNFSAKLDSENADAADRFAALSSKSRTSSIILALLGLVGIGVIGFLTIRTVGGPVRLLVERIEALSGGHISPKLKLNRSDEFGRIAGALDLFSDRMEALVFGLFEALAAGKLDLQTDDQSHGDEIAPRLRKLMASIRGLTSEIRQLYEAALKGRLDYRADTLKFEGEYSEMIRGINNTLDAFLAPVNEAAVVLEAVAAQNLQSRVTGDYQGGHARIKESLNSAVANLDQSLRHVTDGANQVASAAQQIGSGSHSLARSASEQAATLEEIAGSLQEVSGMAGGNAASAHKAQSLVEEAHTSSAQGVRNMESLSSAMERIKSSSDQTAKIVKTIDEIAFQTNLLALNAAVEAARAGESGKGFAVVAEEVRNLAMRSAEAAKNTASLIEEAVHNAEEGFTLNATVLAQLQEINRKVESASTSMTEVALASEQQREAVNQVNKAIEQMNQLTQSTAANAEQSASAAEELSSQAESMKDLVGGFKLSGMTSSTYRGASHRSDARFGDETGTPETDLRPFVGSRRQAKANGHSKKVQPAELALPIDPGDAALGEF